MSMPYTVTVVCPKCGTSFDATCYDSVNTDLAPNLPQKIISGEFFDVLCPSCNHTCHLEYPVLYHDLNKKVMIWVVMQNEKYDETVKDIRKTPVAPGYCTRIVHSIAQLREKVSMLESGRDDRFVEITKCLLFSQAISHFADFDLSPDRTFYTKIQGEEYVEFYAADNAVKRCRFDSNTYSNILQQFAPFVNAAPMLPFEVIGSSWGLSMINKLYDTAEPFGKTSGGSLFQRFLSAIRRIFCK